MSKDTSWFSIITRVMVVVLVIGTFRQAKINNRLEIEIVQLKTEVLENEVIALERYNVQTDCMDRITNIIKGLMGFHEEEFK